ncbi:hypothetical protein [Lichenibacterium dinghuense]|uniref:hypothetical protein n=1 Tax=Lichenibacterium dinghuense TaxID=2895977 RepID=UPI001F465434|nr:hypothetical protein [Lichenibacterium sp. 6Y81]
MHRRPPSPARPVLVLALASALLGGCAEVHHGVETVGRIGGAPAGAAVAADDEAPPSRPDIRTVRPRGAPRAPSSDAASRDPEPRPAALASAVPSPHQIFDFHPAGSRPDSWRQPFVIDTNDGPLAADVRRSSAELKSFLADQKAGRARSTTGTAKVDDGPTGTTRKRCSEMDVATAKPGCGVPRPGGDAAAR